MRQAIDAAQPEAPGLRREANLLERVGGGLAGSVPELVDFDPSAQTLVQRLLRGDPVPKLLPAGAAAPAVAVSTALGTALARCHRQVAALCAVGDDRWADRLPALLPGVLQQGGTLPAQPSDAQRIVNHLAAADDALAKGVGELRQSYRLNAVIHGDVKWANCVVGPGGAVVLVDWEAIRIGDVAWDLAGLLQSLLQRWVAIAADAEPPAAIGESARATVGAYLGELRLRGRVASELADRSVRMAGARLVQTASEASRGRARPTRFTVRLLQLASNVLADPARAATELLGLDGAPG